MMQADPFRGIDLEPLSKADQAEIDGLRQIYRAGGENDFIEALTDIARTNTSLFVRLLAEIIKDDE